MSVETGGQGAGAGAGPAPGSRAAGALRAGLLWLAFGGVLLLVARGLHHLSWLQMIALTR